MAILVNIGNFKTDWEPEDRLRNTDLNRIESNMLYALGYVDALTEFNNDGSITTTYDSGSAVEETIFQDDGNITETLYNAARQTIVSKFTEFLANGNINETVELFNPEV